MDLRQTVYDVPQEGSVRGLKLHYWCQSWGNARINYIIWLLNLCLHVFHACLRQNVFFSGHNSSFKDIIFSVDIVLPLHWASEGIILCYAIRCYTMVLDNMRKVDVLAYRLIVVASIVWSHRSLAAFGASGNPFIPISFALLSRRYRPLFASSNAKIINSAQTSFFTVINQMRGLRRKTRILRKTFENCKVPGVATFPG